MAPLVRSFSDGICTVWDKFYGFWFHICEFFWQQKNGNINWYIYMLFWISLVQLALLWWLTHSIFSLKKCASFTKKFDFCHSYILKTCFIIIWYHPTLCYKKWSTRIVLDATDYIYFIPNLTFKNSVPVL